jgi:hypothetical protein
MKMCHRFAVAGLILALPAFLAVSSGILRFSVPEALISPPLVVGGLLAAFFLNLISVLQVHVERELSGGLAAVNVRIQARRLNLTVVALSVFLTAAITAYLFVENFRQR